MKHGMCLDEQLIKILSQKIISSSDFFSLIFFFLQKQNSKYRLFPPPMVFVSIRLKKKKKSEYQRVLFEIYLQAVQYIFESDSMKK